MSKVVHTFNITEEESSKLEQVYYEHEALKSLLADIDNGLLKPSKEKYDQLVDKYTDSHMLYQTTWSKVVGKKIPTKYSTEKYQANVNFIYHNVEILEF